MNPLFKSLWESHFSWATGILYNESKTGQSAQFITSHIPGEFYNFAVPIVDIPEKLDLEEVKEFLKGEPALFLMEDHQKNGFVELLVKNGFMLESRDSWLGREFEDKSFLPVSVEVVEVDRNSFNDFRSVLGEVFNDFPGNDVYLAVCEKTLDSEWISSFPDITSNFFLIYENHIPVAGAGLFFSEKLNFGYLHDAGTLNKYRGRGYQSDLVKFRINKGLGAGVTRFYTSVEQGSTSWSNNIKAGLSQLHTGNLFVLKK